MENATLWRVLVALRVKETRLFLHVIKILGRERRTEYVASSHAVKVQLGVSWQEPFRKSACIISYAAPVVPAYFPILNS